MTAHRIPLSELEQGIPFEQRHIGPDSEARAKMLAHVGYGSLDELTAAAVPDVIKNADALDLPGARTGPPSAQAWLEQPQRLRGDKSTPGQSNSVCRFCGALAFNGVLPTVGTRSPAPSIRT